MGVWPVAQAPTFSLYGFSRRVKIFGLSPLTTAVDFSHKIFYNSTGWEQSHFTSKGHDDVVPALAVCLACLGRVSSFPFPVPRGHCLGKQTGNSKPLEELRSVQTGNFENFHAFRDLGRSGIVSSASGLSLRSIARTD